MHRVQVWVVPALGLGENGLSDLIEIPGAPPVTLREVDVRVAENVVRMLLIETFGTRPTLEEDPHDDLRRIGRLVTRLSFSCLHSFHVICARLIEGTGAHGTAYREVAYPGSPPGISLFECKVGFEPRGKLDPHFLGCDIAPEVEHAVTWFLSGLAANNPVQQMISSWIGLEALAPVKESLMRCFKCESQFEVCPICGESTSGPAVNKTVGAYLCEQLGVPSKEAKDLYGLRCTISHGRLGMDPEGMQSTSQKVSRLQELLLRGIKKALDWPEDAPPLVVNHGFTILGSLGLMLQGVVSSDDDIFERPSVLPA